MKVILEPKVHVLSEPIFHEHPEYKIPDDGTDAEKIGAFAAKGCYDSYGEGGRSNVENQRAVIESMHGSVAEHVHISLFIEGITRALSLELNRHRPFNISQRSTRYTKEEESAIVLEPYYSELYTKYNTRFLEYWYDICPPIDQQNSARGVQVRNNGYPLLTLAIDPDFGMLVNKRGFIVSLTESEELEFKLILGHLQAAYGTIWEYGQEVEKLIKLNPFGLSGFDLRKFARGKARNILPHGLETRGVWTNNIRGFRWFLELRSERHAEPEVRLLANKIYEAIKPIAPVYFEDFTSEIVNGIPELKPTHSKI